MRPSLTDLLLLEAGALDPAQAARTRAWLVAHPEDAVELVDDEPIASAWRLPPPGMGLGLRAGMPGVLAGEGLRPGDRVDLRLEARPDADRLGVVLLRQAQGPGAGPWAVEAPRSQAELVPLSRYPREADGRHSLSVRVQPPAGRQRLGLALVPLDLPIDWTAPGEARWSALLEAVRRGEVAVGTTDLTVGGG
ncbi:hypothetical protein L6R53_03870 [Myxococcota bacterium]|nr:hypothetical protein [Myxococcota bacterium]